MALVTDEAELEQILELACGALKPYMPDDYKLVIDRNAVQRDEEWYYVVVSPDREGVRSYDYIARLAEAELDLRDKKLDRRILFVPGIPD